MLFFKQIKDHKLSDPSFNTFYKKECHICSITLHLIDRIRKEKNVKIVLKQVGISSNAYADLESGDRCDPEHVIALCRHLNLEPVPEPATCPRLANS